MFHRGALQQLSDLIDVIVHRALRGHRIAPPHGFHDCLVALKRSLRTTLLLQCQFARFLQQLVERFHQADGNAIVRGARQRSVKGRVFDDGRLTGRESAALCTEKALQFRDVLVGDAGRRDPRDSGFEHATHVHQLVLEIALIGENGRQRRHETIHGELPRKRPLAVAHLQQSEDLEHPQRIANRAAADAEAAGEHTFRGQRPALRERAIENQLPYPIGDFFGNPRLFNRLDQSRFTRAGATAGRPIRLDTRTSGWHTEPPDWLDH